MRSITGRIDPQGPFINATVMASPQHVARLKAAGLTAPPPISVRTLVDTGASACVLDSGMIARLNLIQTGRAPIHTPTTGDRYEERDVYDVSFFLGSVPPDVVSFTVGAVRADLASVGFFAIIGWDILSRCVLLCDGPAKTFRLDY